MRQTRLRKLFKNPLAFSIVELVLVIALMSILAASVIPAMRSTNQSADNDSINAYITNIRHLSYVVADAVNGLHCKGQIARLGGYNLDTARGIQDFFQAYNEHSDVYDVELVTVVGTGSRPDLTKYNTYSTDVIVIWVTFYKSVTGRTTIRDGIPSITYSGLTDANIIKENGVNTTPERVGNMSAGIKIRKIWYIKVQNNVANFAPRGNNNSPTTAARSGYTSVAPEDYITPYA